MKLIWDLRCAITEYLQSVSQSDGISVCGDGAAVGPGVPGPDVVDPQVEAAWETVARVWAHHHLPGCQDIRPVFPDHHELAQVLRVAVQSHLVSHRGSVVARLRSDDRSDGEAPVLRLVALSSGEQQQGAQQLAAPHLHLLQLLLFVVLLLTDWDWTWPSCPAGCHLPTGSTLTTLLPALCGLEVGHCLHSRPVMEVTKYFHQHSNLAFLVFNYNGHFHIGEREADMMFPQQQINVVFIIFILSFNVNNCSRNIWITQINILKAAIIKHIIRKHLYNISAVSSKYILIKSDWTIENVSVSLNNQT